ncbi:MAG: hypothetical protein Ta2E_12510 [Mycoplasmoidaceae bacterium]|nr:MAG: hypothetical protein Ta2E_12510 [Mycoplasmoidaceae bacterium]
MKKIWEAKKRTVKQGEKRKRLKHEEWLMTRVEKQEMIQKKRPALANDWKKNLLWNDMSHPKKF